MKLIEFTDKGLYCSAGNFYIDPWKPVDKAVITHAHSDHARWGSKNYLCHTLCKPVLLLRLGDVNVQTVEWDHPVNINGVIVSLHPAGHVIGSSQIKVSYKGEIWVISGDYKTEDDGISGAFEPVRCHHFITESTFGLPIYKWEPQQVTYTNIRNWVYGCLQNGITPVITAYSLGKAQRIIDCVQQVTNRILAHGAVYNVQQALIDFGVTIPAVEKITVHTSKERYKNAVVIAPPSAERTSWMRKFSPSATAICSGWMRVRGNQRRRNADAGFSLSDHADWPGLLQAVKLSGAHTVYVTHGFQAAFSRYLTETGISAFEVKTAYGSEEENGAEEEGLNTNETL